MNYLVWKYILNAITLTCSSLIIGISLLALQEPMPTKFSKHQIATLIFAVATIAASTANRIKSKKFSRNNGLILIVYDEKKIHAIKSLAPTEIVEYAHREFKMHYTCRHDCSPENAVTLEYEAKNEFIQKKMPFYKISNITEAAIYVVEQNHEKLRIVTNLQELFSIINSHKLSEAPELKKFIFQRMSTYSISQ